MTLHVIDAHQHFWDPNRFEYPWMSPKVQPLVRAFLPNDLRPLLAGADVQQTVVVQAISSAAEARWLLSLASDHDFIGGVVAWCDLQDPGLGRTLDELQKHPKFKGVRHQIEDEPQEDWMLQNTVIEGFRELARREIPYDMLARPRHLKYVPEVHERCPNLQMVIDHIGKPRIADRLFEPWARDLESVARIPIVHCKLSGMNTEADWEKWTASDLKPYVEHVVKVFGYERTMFGSDWPVCLLAGSYQVVIGALAEALGPLTPQQESLVWADNAARFYGLNGSASSPKSAGEGKHAIKGGL